VGEEVEGRGRELPVDVGNKVKAGDVLVRLDTTALEAQRAQALAGLEAAKSQLDLLKDPAKQQDLDAAKAAVAAAAAAYNRAVGAPTDEERRAGRGPIRSSQAAVPRAPPTSQRCQF